MMSQLKLQVFNSLQKIISKKSTIEQEGKQTVKSILENMEKQRIITQNDFRILQIVFINQMKEEVENDVFFGIIERAKSELNLEENQFFIEEQARKNIQAKPKQDKVKQPKSEVKAMKQTQIKKNEPSVDLNPEYYRVDYQISHKLYEIYRKSAICSPQTGLSMSFEEKEQNKQTMNYYKIIEIFKDLKLNLQINQKLSILRAIKKFSFNQQYINEEEFTKIFKIIIHGLGFKENIFKSLIADKYSSVHEKSELPLKRNLKLKMNLDKNFSRKLKTEALDPVGTNNRSFHKIRNELSRTIEMSESRIRRHEGHESIGSKIDEARNKINFVSKKTSKYIKNFIDQDPRMAQITGKDNDKQFKQAKRIAKLRMQTEGTQEKPRAGYLNRAMQKNKISKITWESLFNMTQMNFPICSELSLSINP